MRSHLESRPPIVNRPLARYLAAAGAGALLACSFAPLGWWPLAILSPAVLMWLWQDASPRHAAKLGFWFNAGTFAAGTYWLYISIHVFGEAPLWVAFMLMLGLVALMGAYHAALGWSVARWLPREGAMRWLVGLPAAWLVVEWFRGWFLSGFSWLSLGYSQTDTVLANLAPMLGVYGLSAALLVCAGALVMLGLARDARSRAIALAAFAAPWILALGLDREWTQPSGEAVKVAVLQGAVPQDMKWLLANREATLDLYRDLTLEALTEPVSLIVWPESAIPDLANNLVDYLGGLYSKAGAQGAGLVLGAVRASDRGNEYFNSVLALGENGVSWFDKHHLVPFAEFFPVPDFVRKWLRLMSLPYSDFTRGARTQAPLVAGGLKLAASICYEDAYGNTISRSIEGADVLVNVTNDAWFGKSTARFQHFQIARMRAIESQRYLIRAANDGISAIVGPRGEIVAEAPQYTRTVLRASVTPRTGLPPYARWGNLLILSLSGLALTGVVAWNQRQLRRGTNPGNPGL